MKTLTSRVICRMRTSLLAACCLLGTHHGMSQRVDPAPADRRTGQGGGDEPLQLDSFVVTGTNIRRTDAEAALPVTIMDRTDIDLIGVSTGADLYETLTISLPSSLSEVNTGSQGARGDVASPDLRGLGSGSTLLLINGRRVVSAPMSMSENGVPSLAANANFVPTFLVDRVEVLRDGASAIYGADAAAGVINNIISRQFTGRKLSARMAVTQHGGADEYRLTYAEGFRKNNTHIAYTLDYFDREKLYFHQRWYSRNSDIRLTRDLPAPWNGQPITTANGAVVRNTNLHNGATTTHYGQFQRGFINQNDWWTFSGNGRPDGNRGISTSTTPPVGTATMAANGTFFFYPTADGRIAFKQTAPSRNIELADSEGLYYDSLDERTMIPQTERYNFGAFIDHRFNSRIEAFGDVMYFVSHSVADREPVNMQNVNEPGIYVPAANPWNPFGVRFYHPTGAPNADGTPRLVGTPADATIVSGVRPFGLKPRVIDVNTQQSRLLGGLRGRLGDTWQWESAVLYSQAKTHEREYEMFRESWLRYALNRTDSSAYNPFPVTFKIENGLIVVDKPYVNPDIVVSAIQDTFHRLARTQLASWDIKASGSLGRLFRGGDIGLAVGGEVRWETYADWSPPYSNQNPPGSENLPYLRDGDDDFVAHSPNAPISAERTVLAAYTELALPFVTKANRVPLVQELELTLAGRLEHFSIHGDSLKPKASLTWRPLSLVKFRASYNESFRAPNLVQTSITPTKRVNVVNDPYRSEVTGELRDSSRPRTTFKRGSENLTPEEAESWVAGFVLDVPKLTGLSLTFDYWKMKQRDAIADFGVGDTLARDELLLDMATQAALAAGTPINQIDLGSGTSNYKGFSNVTRAPVTDADRAAFAAYNAQQTSPASMRAPVGDFVSLFNDYINLGGRNIEGYELGLQYRLPRLTIGQFMLKGEATRYVRYEEESDGITSSLLDRNGRAKWRANLALSWRKGPWSAGWFTSYYGEFASTSATTTVAVYEALGAPKAVKVINDNGIMRYYMRVEPFIMHNVYATYQFSPQRHALLRDLKVRIGMNNVFDTDPPASDTFAGYEVGTANARGRQFVVELSRQF